MLFTSRFLSIPMAATISLSVLLSSCASPSGGIGGGGGTVGSIGYDYKERQIINQGRAVGAVLGGAAGYAIARNNSRSDSSRIAGALGGALVGGLAGDAIGKGQANKARAVRLNNEAMSDNLARLRADNQKLVAYNQRMARRIADIRKTEASERAKLAKAELAGANRELKVTDKMIQQRESDTSQLVSSQRSSFNTENRKLKSQREVQVAHRNELISLASQ